MFSESNKCEVHTNILDLPYELIVIILKYVNENHQAALVCKKFNEIISCIESKSKILVIRDEQSVS